MLFRFEGPTNSEIGMFNPDHLYWYRGIVRSKYDGDSWRLDIDQGFGDWKHNRRIRLYGIDTPEIKGVERPQGLIALDAVNEWCPEGTIVGMRSYKDRMGSFGRYLAIIWPEGWEISVNQRLLDEGLAVPYKR